MRDYGIITPAFWVGKTGKQLRGDLEAQLLAVYLMTSPHSSMTGVFHCPVLYMAHETGIPFEGASKALERLIEAGFCEYEEATETIFVVQMARFQIADSLKPGDKRIAGLKKDVEKMGSALMRSRFIATYSIAFRLVDEEGDGSPSEAPPKPRTGTGTRSRTETKAPSHEAGFVDNLVLPDTLQAVCDVLKKYQIQFFNHKDPEFTRLISEPLATLDVWEWAALHAIEKQNPKFKFMLGIVRNKITQPQAPAGPMQGITTPGPKGRDPELIRMEAEAALLKPMPFHLRKQNQSAAKSA